jgi:cyclase
VDREGTKKGFELSLIESLGPSLGVPVIASGGAGSIDDVGAAFTAGADAVAIAGLFHYGTETVTSLKAGLTARGHHIRP